MNPLPPQVEFHVISLNERSPSQGLTSSITLFIEEISDTGRSVFTEVLINLSSSNRLYDRELLQNQLASHHHNWLCERLARMISTAATAYGNGLELTVSVVITHRTVADPSPSNNDEALSRMVLLGKVDSEGLKSLEMETEPCSICLDNLSVSDSRHGFPTRMTCSHVFHLRCLLEWLQRKNTCPLCRTVLYDR